MSQQTMDCLMSMTGKDSLDLAQNRFSGFGLDQGILHCQSQIKIGHLFPHQCFHPALVLELKSVCLPNLT